MRWISTSILLACLGCATPYQKVGSNGGYDDFRINASDFEVTFRGNAHTSEETVSKYILRRASELTLQHGFTHFIRLSERDLTRVGRSWSSSGANYAYVFPYAGSVLGYGSYHGHIDPRVAPTTSIRIRCFAPPLPNNDGMINAREFMSYNFPVALAKMDEICEKQHPTSMAVDK